MNNKELPNGAVIKIKGLDNYFLIIAKVPLVEEKNKPIYYDYQGALLPQGIANEEKYFFNEEDISEVVFEGVTDEVTKDFIEGVRKWKFETDIQKGKSGIELA